MTKRLFLRVLLIGFTGVYSCNSGDNLRKSFPGKVVVYVENRTDRQRDEAIVTLDLKQLSEKCQETMLCKNAIVVLINGREQPSQIVGSRLVFTHSFKPQGREKVIIRYSLDSADVRNYPQRAHAELSKKAGGHFEGKLYVGGEFQSVTCEKVPPIHVDHDTYYRFEGPGWESDKVGYRYYLDKRNRIDIFGKKVTQMVLPNVGLDGFDSYHVMSDWGADIFKVGESLGIGSIGTFYNGAVQQVYETDSIHFKIKSDGPVQAGMQTIYYGWEVGDRKFDLESQLSIHAGSRLTKHKVEVSGDLENLVTGLIKTEGCDYIKGDFQTNSKWNYIALWGKQSLMGDNLGTALFYKNADLLEIAEDELNHLVILKPEAGKLKYYFAAAWEGEPDGIKTLTEFMDYLQKTVVELNNPINVIY